MNRTIFRFVILLSLGIVILVPASAQSQDCEPVVLPYYVLFDNQEWTPYWNWPHIWENPSQYPSPMIEDNCWRVNKDDNGIELVSEVDYRVERVQAHRLRFESPRGSLAQIGGIP